MTDLGTITDRNTVRIERLYPVDVDTLWAYLTTPDGLRSWLAEGSIGPERVQLRFHDNGSSIDGAVLIWKPPHVVELEWNGGPTQPAGSVVRLELSQQEGGTSLVLTHTRIVGPDAAPDFAAGWHWHLDTLAVLVPGVQPSTDRPTWQDLHTQYLAIGQPGS